VKAQLLLRTLQQIQPYLHNLEVLLVDCGRQSILSRPPILTTPLSRICAFLNRHLLVLAPNQFTRPSAQLSMGKRWAQKQRLLTNVFYLSH
jgi:hypothetical protein